MADMAHFHPATHTHQQQQHGSGQHPSGYSTLPGRHGGHGHGGQRGQHGGQQQRQMQPRGNGQHVDWDSLMLTSTSSAAATGKREPVVYDGVGPRTSATGEKELISCGTGGHVGCIDTMKC